ncbi:MAG: alkaline metalloproteinase, partial [Pseudomonadota bacterium]
FGFRGSDVLDGGLGDDHLTGGKGRDFFDFRDLQGDDTVKDFTKRDKLVLDRHEFANVHQVFAALEEKDGDVVITGDNGSITLEDVDAHDLGAKSFLFY